MNNEVFGNTMENVRKHRDIKFFTTEKRRKYLLSEPNYHTTNFFTENLLAIEMKKTEILINKTGKILMYEVWYHHVKPKYGEKAKLTYMDTDSFTVYIKTDDIYKDIAEVVETRFGTLNYELDRPLPRGKDKKVIALMKDELVGKITAKFVVLKAKTYSYLIDDSSGDKKAKGAKNCVIKQNLNLKIIKTISKQLNLRIKKLSRKIFLT